MIIQDSTYVELLSDSDLVGRLLSDAEMIS